MALNIRFKKRKKKMLPVHCVCRNCNSQLISRYCHNCGQYLFAGSEKSVKEISYNMMDTVFAWDNKILNTLYYLICYPGKLTKVFFEGKVIKYVYPAKLFWFMSLIFFATLTFIVNNEKDTSKEGLALEINTKDKALEIASNALKEANSEEVLNKKQTTTEQEKRKADNKVIMGMFMSYSPYTMFLLVPLFALLLQIFFFKKKSYYASHMIFTLHLHSFVFLLYSSLIVFKFFFPAVAVNPLIFIFVPCIYFIISLYVVYRPKKRNLLWIVPIIMLVYGIFILIAIVLLAIIIAALEEPDVLLDIFD